MADDKNQTQDKPQSLPPVEGVALELFKARSLLSSIRAAEQIAVRCFQDAAIFVACVKKFRTGELSAAPESVWGADCIAAKLPKYHPINMVSSEWGDRARVNRIAQWLEKHPSDDVPYQEGDLSWSVAETRTARALFPAYADKPAEKATVNA